jgi:hypothetical protein
MALPSEDSIEFEGGDVSAYPVSFSPLDFSAPARELAQSGLELRKDEADTQLRERVNAFRQVVLAHVSLPSHISQSDVLRTLFQLDQIPSRAKYIRRFYRTFEEIEEAHHKFHEETAPEGRFSQARLALSDEFRKLSDIERMRASTSKRQVGFVNSAVARGSMDTRISMLLLDSYAWERIERSIVLEEILPAIIRRIPGAESKRELNAIAVDGRRSMSSVSGPLDVVLMLRERLVLLIDSWSSKSVGELYHSKGWNDPRDVEQYQGEAEALAAATENLARFVRTGEGASRKRVVSRLERDAISQTLAREIFQSVFRATQ